MFLHGQQQTLNDRWVTAGVSVHVCMRASLRCALHSEVSPPVLCLHADLEAGAGAAADPGLRRDEDEPNVHSPTLTACV